MLIGPSSAQAVVDRAGCTIHRRKCEILKLLIDLHVRISETDLNTTCFNDTSYLGRLGVALGEMPNHVWDDFAALLLRRSTGLDPARTTRTPLLHTFPDDLKLYQQLLETDLCQGLRHMMSK